MNQPASLPAELPTSDLARLLHQVGEALGTTLRASLDGDRVAARRVLRTGARRRAATRATQEATADALAAGGPVARRRAAAAVLLVSDVARVSRLVDHLARHVAAGGSSQDLTDDQQQALLLLARFGEERLHQLADGPVGPDMTREYVRCGQFLFDVLACLDSPVGSVTSAPTRDRATTGCCAAMTAAILQASRHATRAA